MAPFGGVKQGIGKVMQSMNSGAKFFFQSDIKAFFTQIPIDEVTNIIFSETSDDLLSDLFRAALTIELGNKDELKGYSDIFPRNGIGVAQGSSLSAFAGNVLLYDLDHELNTSSVTAIRYIDDLFMLSDNQSELANAVSVAKAQLTSLGFSLYEPAPGSTKAAEGNCASGFNLLGCSIQPNRCLPSTGSKQKLIEDIRTDISKSKSSIKDLAIDPSKFDLKHSRSATIKRIGDRLYGWQKSFAFCTHADVFASVDERIAKFILDYDHAVFRLTNSYPMPYRMMALGIPNLAAMPLNK